MASRGGSGADIDFSSADKRGQAADSPRRRARTEYLPLGGKLCPRPRPPFLALEKKGAAPPLRSRSVPADVIRHRGARRRPAAGNSGAQIGCPKMTLPPPAGLEAAIAAATAYGRVTFRHDDPATWWLECCAAVDAAAEALLDGEDDPAILVRRAALGLADLADVLARRAGPGLDVLAAICNAAPVGGPSLERVGREALPLLTDAAANLHRQIRAAADVAPELRGGPITRRLVRHLADLYSEAFRDRDGAPARPSHGDNTKGAPFVRLLEALLTTAAADFEERHGFGSPLAPSAITPKMIRLALAEPLPATIWPGG